MFSNVILILSSIILVIGFVACHNPDETNKTDVPLACEYGGETYQSGERFDSLDGCNTCSCEDGQIACTVMACLDNSSQDNSSLEGKNR